MALYDIHHMIQYKCITGLAVMLNQWWGLKSPPIKASSRRTLLLSMSTYLPPSYQISRRESLWIRYRIQILFCTRWCMFKWSRYCFQILFLNLILIISKTVSTKLGHNLNKKNWMGFLYSYMLSEKGRLSNNNEHKKPFWYLKEVVS